MHPSRALAALALAFACSAAGLLAQSASPALGDEAIEEFLRTAKIVSTRTLAIGVTGSVRATLTDGTLTHDAHIQAVDESKSQFRSKDGTVERDFRDTWRYNIAAYELDRLLDLQLTPVSVERTWKGQGTAFTWWIDDVLMDERERLETQQRAPDVACWNRQSQLLRMFDQLIENTDRNLGNLIITKNWRLWAIDHTRAFRRSSTPSNVASLVQIDRGVLERLKSLEYDTLRKAVGRYLGAPEMRAILSRRDAIVKHYESLGADAVIERGDPAAGCGAA